MRGKKAFFVLGATVLAVGAASVAPAAADPTGARGPVEFKVEVAGVAGSGCPAGTVATAVRDDGTFRIVYGAYTAQAGGSSRPVDAHKNCQAFLRVTAPQDVTYAISSSYHPIYARLENGANATLKFSYYFEGLPWNGMVTRTLNGAYDDEWRIAYEEPADRLLFQPCGERRRLVLNTELRIDKGTSDPSKTDFITMDSLSDGPVIFYRLTWKNCPR
ncbi:DUF4360 domain-containing protein [Actinomadura chibensis]|nr:DUF4360 domain-containing protein [Actinomadura chibensis]